MQNTNLNQKSPGFRYLSNDQIKSIHTTSLEILDDVGVEVNSEEGRDLLEKNGCIAEGKLVKIPPGLVEWAINRAPRQILLYDRTGEPKLNLHDYESYFGLGPTTLNTIDPKTKERRKVQKNDIKKAAKLVDTLDNMDFMMGLGTIDDVPQQHSDRHEFEAMVKNTIKPIVAWSYSSKGLQDVIDMASSVVGGKSTLEEKPFIVSYSEPASPLRHDRDGLNKMLLAVENGVPVIYTSGVQGGGTVPATPAGNLALINAECLSGLVMAQLKKEGAPFLIGGFPTVMDMKTATTVFGSPEKDRMAAAYMEIAHWYDLPAWGEAGCSDSKIPDQQLAITGGISALVSSLSGANLIHDTGYLESGKTSSLEAIILMDEIIDYTNRVMDGIELNEETMAIDTIRRIGHGGNYLTDKHTIEHFEQEYWDPTLIDRDGYQNWADKGSKSMRDRINEKMDRILEEHSPKRLPDSALEKISEIMDSLEDN